MTINDNKNPLFAFDVLLYSLNLSCSAQRRPFCTEFQTAMPAYDPTDICCLCQHPSPGCASFGMPLCRCAVAQRTCSSWVILAEAAGGSTGWGASQRTLKWRSMICISNICFILSTSPLYSNCMSVRVEPTDAKTSSSFEAWDNNKITCYLFMLIIKSTINYYLVVALTRRLAKGNLLSE